MKKQVPSSLDREYLRQCKYSSAEQKLNWLVAAKELHAAAAIHRKKKMKKSR